MGFGCNAAGVVGCRIIDSPRERLIALLTNCFVPCNGRFPALITLISLFLANSGGSLSSALALTLVVLLGIALTLLVSRLLSATILKGMPSSFTLELPPYRTPRVGQVLVRSILDRTLFVLGRAAAVAAPAGLILWLAANLQVDGVSLLTWGANFLDPFARQLGMDGVILIAFLLGLPANEIVLPIILMAYTSGGALSQGIGMETIGSILVANGWTATTAVCVVLFYLIHWPCSTTCLTILRETRSRKWTLLAMLIPTALGMFLCFVTARVLGGLGIP